MHFVFFLGPYITFVIIIFAVLVTCRRDSTTKVIYKLKEGINNLILHVDTIFFYYKRRYVIIISFHLLTLKKRGRRREREGGKKGETIETKREPKLKKKKRKARQDVNV